MVRVQPLPGSQCRCDGAVHHSVLTAVFLERDRFTAMMSGPGKEHGSLHIRFPPNWRRSADRNHGHVSWGPVPRVWKLEVSERESHFAAAEGAEAAETIVSVKVIRPESKGYDAKQVH